MTHGAGGISYGGGGGGGGGGFFTGYHVTTHYHGNRNRRRREESEDDGQCCCALCAVLFYLVFFFLCLMEMKPKTRIILTWLYCIVGATVTGVLIAHHYSSTDLSASPTDMRKVDGISAIFCESVLIDSSSLIKTYKLKSEPKIDMSSSVKYDRSVTTSLQRDRYEYWGFYLLENSVATITVCPDNSMSFYIIRGKKNLDTWIADALCGDCYERRTFLFYCSGSSNAMKVKFTASSSDQYYFLFANEGYSIIAPGPVNADIQFNLDRKVYDLNGSHTVCPNDFDCDVPLSIQAGESIVFYVPRENSLDTSITIYCRPRVYIYIVFFALFPIISGAAVTAFILWLSRRKKHQRSRSESQVFVTSNSEQLHGYTNESCQISTNPPSYTQAPPSYTQAPPSYKQDPPKYEDVVTNASK